MRRLGVAMVGLCITVAACVRTLPGQDPPAAARLYYPNRMALSGDGNSLFVVSTNFDERYNVGWITRVDLPTLLPMLAADANVIVDENQASASLTQSVRVPSLAGDLVVDAAHNRAYLAHRGQGIITSLDITTNAQGQTDIDCGDKTAADAQLGLTHLEQQTSCDRAHMFDLTRANRATSATTDVHYWSDPFALALVSTAGNEYPTLMAGFLGASTLLAMQPGPNAQDLSIKQPIALSSATLGHLLAIPQGPGLPPAAGSLLGTTHFAPEQTARGALYAVDVSLLLSDPAQAKQSVVRYDLGQMLGAGDSPADITGVVFSTRDASRLFVAHRSPSAVVMLARTVQSSSSFDPNGQLQTKSAVGFELKDVQTTGDKRLSQMAYVERDAGDVLAVLSLTGDMLYLFDVSGDSLLLSGRYQFAPGQGPVDIVHVVDGAQHHYLFVTTFFDHGLTVLDISSPKLGDIRLAASIHDTTRLTPDAQP